MQRSSRFGFRARYPQIYPALGACAKMLFVTNPERLSGLDTSFLHLERSGAHMHVASTSVFEVEAPTHAEFRDHIDSRLHLTPRFRPNSRYVPLDHSRPV